MAISPATLFPGKIETGVSGYPYGKAQDVTTPGDGTGTPWKKELINDVFGFQQALLDEAGITPDGVGEKVGDSQYLDAVKSVIKTNTSGTNLIQNHNLSNIITDGTEPPISPTPQAYPPSYEFAQGWFTSDTVGATLSKDAVTGEITLGAGDYYTLVPNTGSLAQSTSGVVASWAGRDGLPITAGVSQSIVGDNYKIVVTATTVFSVKFEQGVVPTKHETADSIVDVKSYADIHDTLANAKSRTDLVSGMAIRIEDRADGIFDVVTGETGNTYNIVQHDTLPIQLKLNTSNSVNVKQFGAVGNSNGNTGDGNDDTGAFLAAFDVAKAVTSQPRAIIIPQGWYRVTQGITIDYPQFAIQCENNRTIIWCDFDGSGLELKAGGGKIENLDVRRVTGKTGTGIVLDGAPECLFDNVKSFNHTNNVTTKDSHLCTWIHCTVSGATGLGLSDIGRCFGCEFIGFNAVLNENGVSCKSDWTFVGGAIEQNSNIDMFVGTSADYTGKYFARVTTSGTHFEGVSGMAGVPLSPLIQVGPSGAPVAGSRQALIMSGGFVLANSAKRKAIEYRNGQGLNLTGVSFKDFDAASTLITADANAKNIRFSGNDWDGVGTYKDINASVVNYIDLDTATGSAANGMSMTHDAAGGRINGVQLISSSKRAANLEIISRQFNPDSAAVRVMTPGVDGVTLFERIAVSSGSDVGEVTFPSATTSVSGSFTSPFKIGGSYFWMNGSQFRGKTTSPASATDGVLIATLV